MRYYLTGATGFIGGHVARQLLAGGHDVIALARSPEAEPALRLAELGVELVKGDITEPDTLAGTMDGADGVFHIAGWYKLGARNRDMAHAINVDGTRHVLEEAVRAAVPKVVYTSTLAVYGDTGGVPVDESYRTDGPWLSLYDRTKWVAHYEVAEPMAAQGLPLVIVLPGLVYGPGDPSNVGILLRDYLQDRLPALPKQGGCWGHVDDVARGHVLAMEKGVTGESYNLGGPCRLWEEVMPIAEEVTGRKPPPVIPPWLTRIFSWLMRPVNVVVPLPSTYHPETLRVASGTRYYATSEKARNELDWDTRPLERGLAMTLRVEMVQLGIDPPSP